MVLSRNLLTAPYALFALLLLQPYLSISAPISSANCCSVLTDKLPDRTFFSASAAYSSSISSYWAEQETELRPACVTVASTSNDVATAVRTLTALNNGKNQSCPFAVRSGGHGKSGFSNINGGVVLDLSALNTVSVSYDHKIASIGPGATWGDVYGILDPMNLTVPGGRHAGVGAGGLSLGGGLSYFNPLAGFTCDNVVNAEVVLASGEIVNANENENDDLHLALRGGSNNFGVVTRIDLETLPLGKVWGGTQYYALETYTQQLQALYDFTADPEYDEYASSTMSFGANAAQAVALNNLVYAKATPELSPKLKLFTDIPSLFGTLRQTNLSGVTNELAATSPGGLRQATYTITFKNSVEVFKVAFQLWNATVPESTTVRNISFAFSLEPLPLAVLSKSTPRGGNLLNLADSSEPLVIWLLSATWGDGADDAKMFALCKKLWEDTEAAAKQLDAYHPHKYIGYAAKGQDVFSAYGAENVAFMREVSKKYDPQQIFQRAVPGGFKLLDVQG